MLRSQAERGRREAEEQLGPALKQNAELRQRLAAAQRQVSQLESLQPFADGLQEQQQQARDEAAALSSALDAANARVRQLEGRCVELEGELAGTAAALTSARRLIDRHEERGRARQHQHHHQQRSGSLTPSELCDLEGATSAFVGGASPQRTARSGGADAASPSGLPSRRRALQQRQAVVQAEQQRRHAEENVQQEKGAAAERAQHHSLVAGLQQQLLEQQRQLAHLQLQQSVALGGGGGDPQPPAEATLRLQTLQRDVEKLQRRNNSLQTALAEASLQHARASAAAGRQVQEAQQDAAQLRRQCDAAQAQLTQLQAAAEALHDDGYAAGGSNAGSAEQLEQLLEYATRCNAVVELNAGVVGLLLPWRRDVTEHAIWLGRHGQAAACSHGEAARRVFTAGARLSCLALLQHSCRRRRPGWTSCERQRQRRSAAGRRPSTCGCSTCSCAAAVAAPPRQSSSRSGCSGCSRRRRLRLRCGRCSMRHGRSSWQPARLSAANCGGCTRWSGCASVSGTVGAAVGMLVVQDL